MSRKENKNSKRIALKSVFLTGSIKRMEDLRHHHPTYIVQSLGFNHSRYKEKLGKPETFTIEEIVSIAKLIDIDPQIITNIILSQLATNRRKRPSSK